VRTAYDVDKVYVAIYDYDARTDDDLSFRVGDLLLIIDDRFDFVTRTSLTYLFALSVRLIGG
jgi:hypothetical protein